MSTNLDSLPVELLVGIFDYLNMDDLLRLRQVCVRLEKVLDCLHSSAIRQKQLVALPQGDLYSLVWNCIPLDYLWDEELYYELKVRGRKVIPNTRAVKMERLTPLIEGRIRYDRTHHFSFEYEQKFMEHALQELRVLIQQPQVAEDTEGMRFAMIRLLYTQNRLDRMLEKFTSLNNLTCYRLMKDWRTALFRIDSALYYLREQVLEVRWGNLGAVYEVLPRSELSKFVWP